MHNVFLAKKLKEKRHITNLADIEKDKKESEFRGAGLFKD